LYTISEILNIPTKAERCASIARKLREAELTASPVQPLAEGEAGFTITDAYRAQQIGREIRLQAGSRLVGHKIGLTSEAMQELLGVAEPDFGYLLDDMVLASGAVVDTSKLIDPRAEAEIAFVLAREIAGPGVTPEVVLDATGEVAPAIEVIDSRVAEWRITIVDTIADNASSGMAVLGEYMPLREVDLAALEARLVVDGDHVQGRGQAVLGHPANAVAWLANALADFGESLAAGEVVLSGAMARALPVQKGAAARAYLGPLGAVWASFT
jgi:2-keto-4-pentenoate hydratase